MAKRTTWVLIADAGRAFVHAYRGPGKGLQRLADETLTQHVPPSRDIAADREGRSMSSVGNARNVYQSRSDPHREIERHFANALAARLDERLRAGAFGHLVIVAAPKMLGDLRKALSPAVAETVRIELDKDLTKIPDAELPAHLDGLLEL
jgi:protein required for attachment to host cells